MDINKDQLVNTFLKGMNTDLSDALIDNSQYRYAENIRVTTNTDHNTGEARLIEGNTKIAEFQDKQIVYINSIRDYVVVICAHTTIVDNKEKPCWSLYVNDNKGAEELPNHPWQLVFGPCIDVLWEDLDLVAISGVMRFESENNIKLYLADGKHVIIPIWVDKSHWPKDTIPTKIDTLTGYQDTFLPAPVASMSNNAGHLKPAKVQYIYRLYKRGGAATTLSPVGNVLSLYKSNSEGYSDKELTNKAVTVRIYFDDGTTGLNRIQLFRITYMYNGQTPTVQRIEDKEIDPTQEYVDIEDYGDSQEELGISELLGLTLMQIKPKIIESKGDILFAANLKYVQDDVDKMFENYDTRSFSSGNYWKLITPIEANSTTGITPYRWDDQSGVWRELMLDTTVTEYPILFNGTALISPPANAELCHRQFTNNSDYTYNQKWWRPFSNDDTNTLLVNSTGGKGANIDWRLDEELVTVSNTEWNAEFDRAYYKCDETYRFGAVLYNNKNQASSVKWIADIRIPPRQPNDYVFSESEGVCTVKMYKIKFYIKNFPEDCKAIQIVQCPRRFDDRHVITQGIVSAPMKMSKSTGETNYMCPSGIMSLQYIWADNNNSNTSTETTYIRTAQSARDTIQFASPEYAYQADDIKNVMSTYKSQISVEHVAAFTTPGTWQTVSDISASNPVLTIRSMSNGNTIGFRFRRYPYNNRLSFYVDANTLQDEKAGDELRSSVNRNYDGTQLKKEVINQADPDNRWKFGYTSFNRVLPHGILSDSNAEITYPNISTISYPEVPDWNKFADGDKIRFMDDITPVGTYSYINWSYPLALDESGSANGNMATALKDVGQVDEDKGVSGYLYPVGTGGKCMIIKFNSNFLCGGQNASYRMLATSGQFAPIHVANIVKLCNPYGGYNKQAIQNSIYYNRGNNINKSEFDAYKNREGATATDMYEVTAAGGDSYVGWFKYNANHMWFDPIYITATKMASVYEVPLDMDIDIYAQCGNPYNSSNTTNGYYMQDEPASISYSGYSQEKPAYQYNTAYNQDPNVITYSAIEQTDISNYDWDVRIHNSDTKTNGENIDSWLTFKAMNYIDVDSRHGEITNLKLFKDRLIFWQNNAVGVLSSNERTMLNDSDGNQIILGNGGILQRSDYISTMYGMKPKQFVTTQSNTTLYWWDGSDKEILAYSENGILPLASLKGVRNYLNLYDENAHPCMFYDPKNKELVSSVVNNESLVYSEQIEAFSSVYKFMPLYGTNLTTDILTTTTDSIYKQWSDAQNAQLFGENIYPKIEYVVNSQNMFPKVFDIQTFGGRFYGGDDLHDLKFDYKTPLKQHSECTGNAVTNREYDFRLDIPRNNNDSYGGRMRGKTMQCELSSTNNSTDFSILYITTKYRMSWS